jgi:hypothetical protein
MDFEFGVELAPPERNNHGRRLSVGAITTLHCPIQIHRVLFILQFIVCVGSIEFLVAVMLLLLLAGSAILRGSVRTIKA